MEHFVKIVNRFLAVNPLSANPTKWSNTLKQFVGKLPTNCLSVFDHFVILALKVLTIFAKVPSYTNTVPKSLLLTFEQILPTEYFLN